MAYAFVRTVDANSGTAQSGLTATCALTAMSAGSYVWLTIKVSSDSRSVSTVVDTALSTWDLVDDETDLSNVHVLLYRCKSLAGAAPTVTVTFDSSSANNVYLWADEYTGLDSTAATDGNNTNETASGSTITVSGVTNALQPDILYVTAHSVNGTNARPITTPASFTRRANLSIGANPTQRCSYDLRLTATGTNSVIVAVTGGNSSIIGIAAAFPESGGGGPTIVSTTDTASLADTASVAESSGLADSATLTERATTAATGQATDALALVEAMTGGPLALDLLSLDDAAFTVVSADTTVPDFSLAEGVLQIGIGGPSDALSLAEGTTRIAAIVSLTDAFSLDDGGITVISSGGQQTISTVDTLTLADLAKLLGAAGPRDTTSLTEALTLFMAAPLTDTLMLAETVSLSVSGGYTGYARAVLVIVGRLAGTLTMAERLAGQSTTQPAGRP